MKIAKIETYAVRIPLRDERRMISALGQHVVSDYVLVRIHSDTGLEGVGEATVMPRWSGETVQSAKALLDRVFVPALIGHDVSDLQGILQIMDQRCSYNWFTKAAVEMACWDLLGKEAKQPIYELLGGAVRERTFACRFSLGAYPVDRAAATAADRAEHGFRTIKVKVGGIVADDVARVAAVREAIGTELQIVVDGNGGWTPDEAIEAMEQLAPLGVKLNEQPTPRGDLIGLARVREATFIPVMADEGCFDLCHAVELIDRQACDVISVYPGKNGGILRTKEIVEYAAAHRVACSMGSNLEWDIATAAMAHLIVACPNLQIEKYPGDVLGPVYHETRIAREPLLIEGPNVTISDRPGLGIEVDWELVQQHRCPDV